MIIQGGNEPIVIQFDPEIPVSDMADISAVLCIHNTSAIHNVEAIFKRWSKTDMDIDEAENVVSCPLTQQETMNFKPGKIGFEMKWISRKTGYVGHLKVTDLEVGARDDERILEV